MTVKSQHKDLKRKVNEAEDKRNVRRGYNSWYDLRVLKKLKLQAKDKLQETKLTKYKIIQDNIQTEQVFTPLLKL